MPITSDVCRNSDSRVNRLGFSRIARQIACTAVRQCPRVLNIFAASDLKPNSGRRRPPKKRLEMRFKPLRKVGLSYPNKRIAETSSITASSTQSPTEAVEPDDTHKEGLRSVPNRFPMACRSVPTSRPQGLNGKRAGRVARHGDILGLPSQPLFPAASSELNE